MFCKWLLVFSHLLPAVAVGRKIGDVIRQYVKKEGKAIVVLSFGGMVLGVRSSPVVAAFSSRGPNVVTSQILKPDVIKPGVNILAGWSEVVGPTGLDSDSRKTEYNIMSGISLTTTSLGLYLQAKLLSVFSRQVQFVARMQQNPKLCFPRAAVVCMTLCFITLLSMVIVALYKSNKPKQFMKGSNKSLQGPPKLVILHMDMAIHSYDDIMRITKNLSEKYIIGYGASSTVYKCVLKSSRPVEIKRIYTQYPQNMQEFKIELGTVGRIRHRNLVSLHGYSLSPYGNLLFYDYMENGSLWDLLHGPSKKVKLDWETRLKIAIGSAQGLAYLHHDCDPRIIHGDVKSSNILLDENFEDHLSDFGIAKCIPTTNSYTLTYVLGTIGYIDPEYARASRLTEKSDVYSFGIVLLELLTGKKVVDNEANLHQLILSKG